MNNYFVIIIGAIFINNIVLSQFLGICPFLGVSKKLSSALGMGAAVAFVMTIASTFSWLLQYYILEPLEIEYLQTIAFILVIASLVQFVELVIRKMSPSLYKALGVYLPLITTNCAVLGVALLNILRDHSLSEAIVYSIANAVGFTLALVLFAGIRERLDQADIPASLKGTPIALIVAGIMSVSFLGFTGLL